ncbi:MAG: hypothetical protein ACKOYM_10875, partial [Actinomycetes bacterium]
AAVTLVGLVGLAGACSSESDTRVLPADRDAASDGPQPTAPGARRGDGDTSGGVDATNRNPALTGTVDIAELVRRLDALQAETDACTLLTGQALANVTGADINLSSLLSNPSGFTQLFSALQRTYVHLVDIAPAQIDGPLSVLGGLWGQLSKVNPRSSEAEAAVAAAVGSPQVQAANDSIASWITTNCSADSSGR